MKECHYMGIRSKLTNNITNKVGNSLLNIEEIKEKGDLPTTQEELRQRRERAETLVKRNRYFPPVLVLSLFQDLILE